MVLPQSGVSHAPKTGKGHASNVQTPKVPLPLLFAPQPHHTLDDYVKQITTVCRENPLLVMDHLIAMGYDCHVSPHRFLSEKEAIDSQRMEVWKGHDVHLVRYIEEIAGESGCDALNLPIYRVGPIASGSPLSTLPIPALRLRFAFLKSLNESASALLPFADVTPLYSSSMEYVLSPLFKLRGLLFHRVKFDFAFRVLQKVSHDIPPPSISIDRLLLSSKTNSVTTTEAGHEWIIKRTVFGMAYEQLKDTDARLFHIRKPSGGDPHMSLRVQFSGEHVQGDSGPYRQFFNDISSELCGGSLPFLVLCPNGVAGGSRNREKYVLAPSRCRHLADLKMLRFLGVLMGMAMRTSVFLPLDLPSIFWKPLVGELVTLSDLQEVDESIHGLNAIRMSTEDMWEGDTQVFYEVFECTLSDGSRVPLLPGGEKVSVTFKTRNHFCDLVENMRLNESNSGIAAIAEGLGSIVPPSLLSLFTWEELSWKICGRPFIDVELLRRHTKYGEVSVLIRGQADALGRSERFEDSPVIDYFWSTLKDMGQNDLRKFIRFAWAQDRLPADDAEFTRTNTRMLLKPFETAQPDSTFPKADTCFFNVMLPQYTTQAILKEKLSFAINNTANMDADAPGGEGEWVAMRDPGDDSDGSDDLPDFLQNF